MSLLKSLNGKIILGLFALLSLLLFQMRSRLLPPPKQHQETRQDTVRDEDYREPTLLYGFRTDGMHIVEGRVKRNQRFVDLLKGYYVAPHVRQQIHLLPKKVFDFRKVKTNTKYTLLTYSGSTKAVKALIYKPNLIDYVVFHMEDSLFLEFCQRKVEYVERTAVGVIKSSLAETIASLRLSPQLTNRFVDIFAWEIDFQRLQKGDLFKLIYEDRVVEGTTVGIGRIRGAYFDHSGSGHCAFPFDQGKGLDYFDEEGNSLRKTLLKYPIEFTRISSRYTRRRFHPVSKIFKPHLGTDFAAAMGTPIRSVGDGVVVEARYRVYNGNYVKIRHNNTYTTQYLHMSRIAPGIRKGVKVSRGQKIGFVGKTGLATGPHLCYRFWKNGTQVDALKVKLPPSDPVQGKHRPTFFRTQKVIVSQLDSISPVKG